MPAVRFLRAAGAAMALAVSLVLVQASSTPAGAEVGPVDDRPTFIVRVFPHDTSAVSFWDSWGARRSGGRRHQGVDILSPRGTEIRAVADGTVTDFGHQRLSGLYLRIDHGDGWKTTYMHLNNDTLGTDDGAGGVWTAIHPLISIGTEVVAGQVIGYVGDSGNAEGTQPHTHFEMSFEGTKVNPYPYIAAAWERDMRTPDADLTPR